MTEVTATEAPDAPATIQPGITEGTFIVEELLGVCRLDSHSVAHDLDAWVRRDPHAEGEYASAAFKAWAKEHAAPAGATYRVLHFEFGHWTVREFTITARTEYDIDEVKPAGGERPF